MEIELNVRGAGLDQLQALQLRVWVHVWPKHEEDRYVLARLLVDCCELKWRLLSEVAAKEEADETLDFSVQLVWVEATHNAEAHHVRVDNMLLHLLPLRKLPLLLHFVLGVLRDTLDDCKSDSLILFNVLLAEVIENFIDYISLAW